ncbi:MAG: iron uptake porin [Leptolyngbya sp.]|nr:iron uptake porin [Leptolyngbya sp.]
MSKLLWKALLAAPAAGAAFAVSSVAVAAESAPSLNVSVDAEPIQLAQITSVSELTDVSPSDWAFQALQSLVENYGCIQGYPDRTFRGNRSLTRYEFAAGLNACLDVMAVLISQSGVNPDDIAAIRRLQEEYQAELATLRGRVDGLEAETATLRAQQFSTTTKLRGQADMHLVMPFDTISADFVDPVTGEVVDSVLETSTSVATRARLNFDTSLTGNDLLRIRLQGAQGNALNPFGGLNNAGGGTYSAVRIDDFYYRFPLSSLADITLAATGMSGDDWVTSTIVPFGDYSVADAGGPQFYDAGSSTSSGAGLGVSFGLGSSLASDVGYTAGYPGASDPAVGVFSAANQSYIGQISFIPDGFLNAAATYIHSDGVGALGETGAIDTFAGLLKLDFGGFFVAGHGAYSDYEGGNDFSWNAGVGFDDFLLEGSAAGIYAAGLPRYSDEANPFLVEGYYSIPFSKYLSVTPAIIYGDAKFGGDDDSTGLWGALRATFTF